MTQPGVEPGPLTNWVSVLLYQTWAHLRVSLRYHCITTKTFLLLGVDLVSLFRDDVHVWLAIAPLLHGPHQHPHVVRQHVFQLVCHTLAKI